MTFQLKGCPYPEVSAEVEKMIRVLHLEDKTKVATSKLSGGMKRKLSVGIALIAGSKVIRQTKSMWTLS
jgi:ATP-binding cassette subfamily A (ABC1) protein 3